MTASRTIRDYKVRYQRDLWGNGLDWRLDCVGSGHWCEGGTSRFGTEPAHMTLDAFGLIQAFSLASKGLRP